MSFSEAPVSTSSETLVSSSLEAPVPSSTAPSVRSSSTSPAPAPSAAPALAPSAALLPAVPLSSPGGRGVFTVMVPPARPSLGFAKKKVVG